MQNKKHDRYVFIKNRTNPDGPESGDILAGSMLELQKNGNYTTHTLGGGLILFTPEWIDTFIENGHIAPYAMLPEIENQGTPLMPTGEITNVMLYSSGETSAKITMPDTTAFEVTFPAEAMKGKCIEERFALIMKRARHHLKCMSAE